MRVTLLPQTEEDLDRIAEPLFSKILHRLELLKDYPEMGAPMIGPFAGYRSTVVELFRVVYRILPADTLEIAYVRDCRRGPLA